MSGLEQIIVGYRDGDPRIGELWEQHGHRAVPHKGCISCGRMTWFVPSGADTIRNRDPQPVCDYCWQDPRIKDQIYKEL